MGGDVDGGYSGSLVIFRRKNDSSGAFEELFLHVIMLILKFFSLKRFNNLFLNIAIFTEDIAF